jgi:phosphoribosylformylglycinamidine synthase I
MKRAGVLKFPGTNCDRDVFTWAQTSFEAVDFLWHQDQFEFKKYDFIFLPGGFSYGDYLRCGALASLSPAMQSLKDFVKFGGYVMGICNGFQILCEAKLLPGVLMKNSGGCFIDDWSELIVNSPIERFSRLNQNEEYLLPIAHGEGNYFIDSKSLAELYENDQVWLKYKKNLNGSVDSIAGVTDRNKKVFGLMPHPERAMAEWMGSTDGKLFF